MLALAVELLHTINHFASDERYKVKTVPIPRIEQLTGALVLMAQHRIALYLGCCTAAWIDRGQRCVGSWLAVVRRQLRYEGWAGLPGVSEYGHDAGDDGYGYGSDFDLCS